jgi:hypothetical protein
VGNLGNVGNVGNVAYALDKQLVEIELIEEVSTGRIRNG